MPDGADGKATAPTATSDGASSTGGFLSRLSELAWRALPAIGSAIGFVGFVAIVGGAIEWIRFDAAQLPATQAVLAVPKQELVVVGALALSVFVFGAVLAVLAVYLIDSEGNATPQTARGLIALGVIEMSVTLLFIGRHAFGKYLWLGVWLILILFVAGYFVGLVMRDFRRRTKVKHARGRVLRAQAAVAAAADAQVAADLTAQHDDSAKSTETLAQARGATQRARSEFERAIEEWRFAAERVVDLQRGVSRKYTLNVIDRELKKVRDLATETPTIVETEAALDDAERALGHAYWAAYGQAVEATPRQIHDNQPTGSGRKWVVGLAALAAAILICVGFGVLAEELSWTAILFVVVAMLTVMNVLVARATDRFPLYGIAVFFSVLMFGAALTIARTLHKPKVQPIALVRKGDEIGICGVYITQTSDRVYIGRLPLEGRGERATRPSLIFWVPTSNVELVSEGQYEPVGPSFPRMAEAMLARLYDDRAEEAPPTLKNTTITRVAGSAASDEQITTASETPPTKQRPRRHPHVTLSGQSCTAQQHIDP